MSCTAPKPCGIAAMQQTEDVLEGGETLMVLRERGTLKVGFSSFVPWAMQDINGEWVGFEIDVAKKLTRDLGLQLELVPTAWAGIIPALLNQEFDVIIAGMGITPQRAEQVKFSIPYEYSKTVLLLNQRIQATALKDLNQPRYRFVGRAGSTPLNLTQLLFHRVQIQAFDDDSSPVLELANGQADGFLTSSVEAARYIENNPDTIYLPDWGRELTKDDIAFAFPKDAEALWVEYINQWIEMNWENSFLEEKSRYWFESRDWTKDHQLTG